MSRSKSALVFDDRLGFAVRRTPIRIAVPATVFGHWAVHRAVGTNVDEHSGYMVTHIPSGYCLGQLVSEDGVTFEEAVAIAQRLEASPLNRKDVLSVSGAAWMATAIVGEVLGDEHVEVLP